MAFGALLIPVTGHAADSAALDLALAVVQGSDARLSAVCIRPDPAEIVRLGNDWTAPVILDSTLDALEDQAASYARAAAQTFLTWQARNRLAQWSPTSRTSGPAVRWSERIGAPSDILREMARFADLVVMRGLGPDGPFDGDAILNAVMFDAGRPVLLAPAVAPEDLFSGALIAWAGGREESHAIMASLPLLARMRRVAVRTVADGDGLDADELVAYLGCHGIAADMASLPAGGHSVAEALSAEAGNIQASLLIMGGYHHSRTREAVFGGTTRSIVANVTLPVLLAH